MKLNDAINMIKEHPQDKIVGRYNRYGLVIDNQTTHEAIIYYNYKNEKTNLN